MERLWVRGLLHRRRWQVPGGVDWGDGESGLRCGLRVGCGESRLVFGAACRFTVEAVAVSRRCVSGRGRRRSVVTYGVLPGIDGMCRVVAVAGAVGLQWVMGEHQCWPDWGLRY